jgi:arylsulfatase A-like enzyme
VNEALEDNARVIALTLLLAACGGSNPGPTPVSPDQVGTPFSFAQEGAAVKELELPESSREGEIPLDAPVTGPFKRVRTVGGVVTWETRVPIRPRNLFFSSPPSGMSVVDKDGKSLSFADGTGGSKRARSWDFTAETVQLRLKEDEGEPADGAFRVRYTKAQEREEALNLEASGLSREDFAFRSLQLGEDTRTGVFLPAPGVAAWDVALPNSAALQLDATILPPEVDDGVASDGAALRIEVEVNGEVTTVHTAALPVGDWTPLKLDLSRWAGQTARVRFVTEPGASALLDYVFLADPVVYTPSRSPRRLLMVFVDTLRPDHMSLYGYERQTTPKLAKWAEGAAVFENARSVAPWTLPSARTALSGRQPELWQAGPLLPEHLAEAGWATGAFVGNVYLSTNFDMSWGWNTHNCVNWPVAEVQIEKVEAFLERYPDRDAAVMLHLMDMHLPYTEPLSYRYKWAAKTPPGGMTERMQRATVRSGISSGEAEAVKQYVIDRYDQNLNYLDDQLTALFAELGEDTTVVIFADHGEEFWDHKGFEHGHTLYDELLRVPLVVKAPGVSAARLSSPVSLLDLTPTVLELVGLEPEGQGVSLLPAIRGEGGARQALEDRHQAFGRPLYGNPRWGVLTEGFKWTSFEGKEELYNLSDDPGEAKDLHKSDTDTTPYHQKMAEALHREVPVSWRVEPSYAKSTPGKDMEVRFQHPDGFAAAWLGDDPLVRSKMEIRIEDEVLPDTDGEGEEDAGDDSEEAPAGSARKSLGNTVVVTFKKGYKGTREIYLVPVASPEDFGELTMVVEDTRGKEPARIQARENKVGEAKPDGTGEVLMRASAGGRSYSVTFTATPIPSVEGVEVAGYDAENEEALRALGYLE